MAGMRSFPSGRGPLRSGPVPLALFALALAMMFPDPAAAFDHARKGFVLELGIGPAISPSVHRETEDGQTVERQESGFAVLTRVRIGFGVTTRWMLTYVNDVAWTLESYGIINDAVYATGLTGVGATTFLGSLGAPWTLELAAGMAGVSNMSGDIASDAGPGIELGVGREVVGGCLLRLTYAHAWLDYLPDRSTLGLTVSRIWY